MLLIFWILELIFIQDEVCISLLKLSTANFVYTSSKRSFSMLIKLY